MSRGMIVGFLILASTILGLLVSVAFGDPSGTVFFVAYGGVGAYLASRRPSNSIGWLLMATAWGLALGSVRVLASPEALLADGLDRQTIVAAWAQGWGWSLAFIGFLGLTLVFPTGHLPAGHARWPGRIAFGALICLAIIMAIGPTISVTPVGSPVTIDIDNPLAIAPEAAIWALVPSPSALYATMFGIFVLGVIGLLVRFHRSAGLARLQYRWLITAIVFVAVATLAWAIATFVLSLDAYGLAWVAVVLAYPGVPIAIAVAVLRYRLYDIDRIVSRTIAYGLVTAVLFGVFAGVNLALQGVLSTVTANDSLTVAASTLAVAALFNPVRSRVQRVVDRRFNRARYDAEQTVAGLATRLRDELDLPTLASELDATVRRAIEPSSVGLWLRGGGR